MTSTMNTGITEGLSIRDMMDATLRLSDLLNAESAMIGQMRIKDIATIHDEKLKLTKKLEVYQQALAKDPSFVMQADAALREELILLTDDLAVSVEENFRKVSASRAVNNRVMQAIMDVISEQHRPGTYGRSGTAAPSSDLALSINFNQSA